MHQTLTVVDGFVAGHRSCRQPGWSSEHQAGKGEVPPHQAGDLGADDTGGNMRRSRQPRPAPRPGHAHLLLAWALTTARNHIDHAVTAHRFAPRLAVRIRQLRRD
jgi:hypothetical protein